MESNSEYFLQQREIEYHLSLEEKKKKEAQKLLTERLNLTSCKPANQSKK